MALPCTVLKKRCICRISVPLSTSIYKKPFSHIGNGPHLNRCCSSQMVYVSIRHYISVYFTFGIDCAIKRYIRHAWTQRQTVKETIVTIVSTILLEDGSVITYIDNYDNERDAAIRTFMFKPLIESKQRNDISTKDDETHKFQQ